jgi:NAD-dependent dihydropyrimidine dehydrogenase PreA subunit
VPQLGGHTVTVLSYRQVLIGEQMVGLLGLDELFEDLWAQGRAPTSELAPLLLEGVEQTNYVFPKARPMYAEALLREYGRYWRQQQAGDAAPATRSTLRTWQGHPREQVPWYPTLDRDRCDGCGECLDFCAFGVYAQEGTSGLVVVVEPFHCVVGCDACARVCTRGAIRFPPQEMLALFGA